MVGAIKTPAEIAAEKAAEAAAMAAERQAAEAERQDAAAKEAFFPKLQQTAPREYQRFQQLYEQYADEQNSRLPIHRDNWTRRMGDSILSDSVSLSDVIEAARKGKPLNYVPSPEAKIVLDALNATVKASNEYLVANGQSSSAFSLAVAAPKAQTRVEPVAAPVAAATKEQLDAVETTFNDFAKANSKFTAAYDKLVPALSGVEKLNLDNYLLATRTNDSERPKYKASAVANESKYAEVVSAAFENNETKKDFRAARAAVPGNTPEATDKYIEQVAAISKQGKVATTADVNHSSGQTLAVMLKNARPAEAPVAAQAETQVASTNPPVVSDDKKTTKVAKADKKAAPKDANTAHVVEAGDTLSAIVVSDHMKTALAEAKKVLQKMDGATHSNKEAMDLALFTVAAKSGIENIHKIDVGQKIAKLTEADFSKMAETLQLAGKFENGHLALGKNDSVVAEVTTPKVPKDTSLAQAGKNRTVS